MPRRILTRSKKNRVIAGVCIGISKYLNVEPVLVRFAFILASLFGGWGIITYILCWVLIPKQGSKMSLWDEWTVKPGEMKRRRSPAMTLGTIMLCMGVLMLLNNLNLFGLTWNYTWPIILIFIGLIITSSRRRKK